MNNHEGMGFLEVFHFLPQDRVCEFAKLTPIQLLEETEKAVGDPELPVHHRGLIDKSRELKRLEITVKQNRETLAQLRSLNAEQEKDVQRVHQRKQLLAKAESMKKKLPWLRYDMKKMEYKKAQEQEAGAKKKLDEAAKILNDLARPIEEEKHSKGKKETAVKKVSNLISNNAKKRMEIMEKEYSMGIQAKGKYTEMEELRKQDESRQQRITRAREDFVAAELELSNQPLYDPPRNEIVKVQHKNHAAYLEDHVPYYIWKSFVTLDPADRDMLVRNLKTFDVPVLNYVSDNGIDKMPFHISNEMRKLGIYSRLDQVFDAPNAVKDVLISQHRLDHSYIGTHETDKMADRIPQLEILDLWTPANHYRWTTSRYGGHISASVESVRPSRLFSFSSDIGDIERLRSTKVELEGNIANLEETIKSLQSEQRHLEDEAASLIKQREEIISTVQLEKKKRREMQNRVDLRKRKLESMMKEDDLETNIKKLVDQARNMNVQRFRLALETKKLLVEAVSLKWSFAEKHISSIELDMKIRELEIDLKQQEKAALQATMQFEEYKKVTEHCKQELLAAKRQAESIALITDELAQEFREMPATVEELEAAIQDTISEANSILFLNQNILQEYESRQHKIDSIALKLEADDKELKRHLSEIETLKESWIPTLRNLVAKINETFSHNFQEMAIAGEVSLDEHEMDFDKFGILIKVKFREAGQLQVLSAHHQSGGERSVSTILYLVSLQDLTNCPFRVVDEINQGMDPINERKMFQQLVRAASQPSTPQCFLLTPKLLPDLEYSDACSILNIMNGPWIEMPAKDSICSTEGWPPRMIVQGESSMEAQIEGSSGR
ncbi:hypothetical protein QJS04_geneDACA016910 [Acorus gramineus]|uniref:Structural maintenance of chromosomes protein 5 n=1 Tax=Acorus gramineus TaxID=55184 RepID=A0AAV9BSZ3_ACOGR|nr:hypothetical protein QJS04_geneDACA016910 [Acorus gramineus]